jgi:hypothetical protein
MCVSWCLLFCKICTCSLSCFTTITKKICLSIKKVCTTNFCKSIPIKRWFLPFVGLLALFAYEELRDVVYLPLLVSFVFFIIFWNFPFLVYYTASRPLYYEDLFIDEKKLPNYDVDPKIKKKFQAILIWVLICTNTLLVAALSEYWLYKTDHIFSYMEILGITGGIIKIFQIINNTIGRIMLKILRHYVKKENTLFNVEQRHHIENIIRLKRIASTRAFQSIEMSPMDPKNIIIKMTSDEQINR